MFGINGSEFIILAVLAIVILGPEKLPEYTRAFTDWLRVMRDKAEGAKAQFKEETGTDFDEVDWRKYDPRQYDPRRIIRDALIKTGEEPEWAMAQLLAIRQERYRVDGLLRELTIVEKSKLWAAE